MGYCHPCRISYERIRKRSFVMVKRSTLQQLCHMLNVEMDAILCHQQLMLKNRTGE